MVLTIKNNFLSILILGILIAPFHVSAHLPAGYLIRDISDLGLGWANRLQWYPGESTAVWIEIPPNNRHLARLVEWNRLFKRTIIPAGVRDIACGTVDSVNYVLCSILVLDTLFWDNLGIELCPERGKSEQVNLPSGTIPGLVSWDCETDTLWFALCFRSEKTPVRFYQTFDSMAIQTERPLPFGTRFPIGAPPSDTTGPCYQAIFQKDSPMELDLTDGNFMIGIIPDSDLDFIIDANELIIIDNGDSLRIKPKNCSLILDIAWSSDGKNALLSIFGTPSRVSLLNLVWPED
ncbi:hypothetical protein KAH81_04720 [bacterium]|nr:hypothetical protein [bacterium]